MDATNGSIGTPLDNAIGYACRYVGRRLVKARAAVNKIWHGAAVGQLARMDELLAADPTPTADDVDEAFWQA